MDPSDDSVRLLERERKAYREANRLLVGAGIILAGAGVRRHAPEMKALSAALRAVNRAGGIEGPSIMDPLRKERNGTRGPSESRRLRRAAL